MMGSRHPHVGRALTGLCNPIPKSKPKVRTPIEAFFIIFFN
ncbi:hypothetical protein [Clostridium sp. LCP25S3_F8]